MPDLLEEETYWSLLNSTLKENYPGFLSHLSDQEGSFAEEGQLAVLEFKDAQVATAPVVRTLETSRALKRYLNQPPNDVKQRAFILEGLPRNFIQILGEDLKVPPDFFAAHWSCPIVGSLLNRTPRHYDVKNRFILRFPRLHRARIQARIGDEKSPFYSIEADGNRLLSRKTIFGDMNGPLESPEHLSFWSTEGATPRNMIFLVDPPLGDTVRWKDSPIPRRVDRNHSIQLVDPMILGLEQQGSWYPFCASLRGQSPPTESMFKDLCLLAPSMRPQPAENKNECIQTCTRIVLSAWTAMLRIVETQVIQESCRMSIGSITLERTATELVDNSWAQPWHPRNFARLVMAKSALDSIAWELERNMDALGLYSKTDVLEPWEAEAWDRLRQAVQMLKVKTDNILQAYMQAVSIRESVTSNKQALHVGYLTSLATVFIPISFVAAIFSMGGDFAAGESRFWVYWTIAIPVLAVGCWLLFTSRGRRSLETASAETFLV